MLRVIDRDSKTDEEIESLKAADPKLCVLLERDLENFLLSEEVLRLGSRVHSSDPAGAEVSLIHKRAEFLATADYPDDVKQVAGKLFDACKVAWDKLAQPGQDRHAFMRDVCAPLIASDTDTYAALRSGTSSRQVGPAILPVSERSRYVLVNFSWVSLDSQSDSQAGGRPWMYPDDRGLRRIAQHADVNVDGRLWTASQGLLIRWLRANESEWIHEHEGGQACVRKSGNH